MSSRHEAKYYKTALHVRGSVRAVFACMELALPEEEIPKHVPSMQYQVKVFKNVNCFMSLRRRR